MTDPTHDITTIFNTDTAAMLRDAWTCANTNADPEPIREHYRNVPHRGFRDLLATIMGAGR